KSSEHEKIFDFLARVNSVTECECGDAITVEDGPFVSYARPIIDDLVSLNQELTRGQLCGRRRLKDLGQPFLAHHIKQKDAACLQTFINVAEHFEVVGLVFEVPEGREHVDSEIEATWSAKASHVFEAELHGDERAGSQSTILLEPSGRAIDTRHREPAFRDRKSTRL